MVLSKTNYLLYRTCPQNAWVKIFEPAIFHSTKLTEFDKMIIETGNEIDSLARDLFPGGILLENRKDTIATDKLIAKKEPIIYQPVFCSDKFETIPDILIWNNQYSAYDIYEAKSTVSGENKKANDDVYRHDLAFQLNVLKQLFIPINRAYIIRLNCDYVRGEKLNINELFIKEDFTDSVNEILDDVLSEMESAYNLLQPANKPLGYCSCVIKGRSAHCSCFSYLNPNIPEYSVHDIARIGNSKKKLEGLIDGGIFSIFDVPEDFDLTDIQRNQVNVAQSKKVIIDGIELKNFFKEITYPISFIDYETFPSAVPRFQGYSPYNQIPFQFSLHVLNNEGAELEHYEFLHTENCSPDLKFIEALQKYLPRSGSVIVWNKQFESGINAKLADRQPEFKIYLDSFNERIIDLEVPFKKQYYVHPGFLGKTSIKKVLPTLAPEFSYKTLNIQEGGTASETWNKIVNGEYSEEEVKQKSTDLLAYCNLDTLAMYEIWKHCINIT